MRNIPSVCGHFWCDHKTCLLRHRSKPKRINTKDHFELRYLRWDYLIRTQNPKDNEIFTKNKLTIENFAYKYFVRYEELLRLNSLDKDDLKNIIRCFIVSFEGLWSFNAKPDKLERFKERFRKAEGRDPPPEIIAKKNNSDLMSFIAQKLDDMINVFKIKNKNQIGFFTDEFYKISAKAPMEKIMMSSLYSEPTKEGWKKISKKEYFALKPTLLTIGRDQYKKINNYIYKSFASGGQVVAINEDNLGNVVEAFHDQRPDALTQLIEAETDFDLSFLDNFSSKNTKEKIKILSSVIELAKTGGFSAKTISQVEALKKSYETQRLRF